MDSVAGLIERKYEGAHPHNIAVEVRPLEGEPADDQLVGAREQQHPLPDLSPELSDQVPAKQAMDVLPLQGHPTRKGAIATATSQAAVDTAACTLNPSERGEQVRDLVARSSDKLKVSVRRQLLASPQVEIGLVIPVGDRDDVRPADAALRLEEDPPRTRAGRQCALLDFLDLVVAQRCPSQPTGDEAIEVPSGMSNELDVGAARRRCLTRNSQLLEVTVGELDGDNRLVALVPIKSPTVAQNGAEQVLEHAECWASIMVPTYRTDGRGTRSDRPWARGSGTGRFLAKPDIDMLP